MENSDYQVPLQVLERIERADFLAGSSLLEKEPPEALVAALEVLCPGGEIESCRYMVWNNSAMGCGEPGAPACQVITPGYKVSVRYEGSLYVFHTDISGLRIKKAS